MKAGAGKTKISCTAAPGRRRERQRLAAVEGSGPEAPARTRLWPHRCGRHATGKRISPEARARRRPAACGAPALQPATNQPQKAGREGGRVDGQRARQTRPIEGGPGIGLAGGADTIAVPRAAPRATDRPRNRVRASCARPRRTEHRCRRACRFPRARTPREKSLQRLRPSTHRFTGVPGPLGAADELRQGAVARDQEVGRHLQAAAARRNTDAHRGRGGSRTAVRCLQCRTDPGAG